MSSTKIIANSTIIYQQFRNEITEGKRLNWRMTVNNNVGNKMRFTEKDIDNMMDIDNGININDMVKLNFLMEKLVLGEITPEQIVFISFDSNIVCEFDICEYISYVRESTKLLLGITNPIIVFIDTYISSLENKYKLGRQELFDNYKIKNIKNYFKFINGETMFYDGSSVDYIHKVEESYACNVLDKEESQFFSTYDNCYINPGVIQEINDNSQLEILLRFRDNIVGSNLIFLTKDKGLQSKCIENGIIYSFGW